MEYRNLRWAVLFGVAFLATSACSGTTLPPEPGPVAQSSVSTLLVTTSSVAPSTTTTRDTVSASTSTVAALHQWGHIDNLVACPDYLEALITNDKPGELRLTWVYIYFPDQPDWQDWAAWWDDPERLLPSIAAGESTVWGVTPVDVDRDERFAPGDYRVMISTEFNPNPDQHDPPIGTSSSETSFVDGTLPSPLCD